MEVQPSSMCLCVLCVVCCVLCVCVYYYSKSLVLFCRSSGYFRFYCFNSIKVITKVQYFLKQRQLRSNAQFDIDKVEKLDTFEEGPRRISKVVLVRSNNDDTILSGRRKISTSLAPNPDKLQRLDEEDTTLQDPIDNNQSKKSELTTNSDQGPKNTTSPDNIPSTDTSKENPEPKTTDPAIKDKNNFPIGSSESKFTDLKNLFLQPLSALGFEHRRSPTNLDDGTTRCTTPDTLFKHSKISPRKNGLEFQHRRRK